MRHLLDEKYPLLSLWNRWQGKIDCFQTKKIWEADELRNASKEFASYLISIGLKKNDLVIMGLTNTVAFPVTMLALLSIGCNPLLLNAAAPQAELERLEAQFNVKYLIHDYLKDVSKLPVEMCRSTFELCGVPLGISPCTIKTGERYDCKHDGIILHPTSGTYGLSRYCLRSQRAAVSEAVNYVESIDIYKSIEITITTPIHHAFSFGFGLIASLLTDSKLNIFPVFNPRILLKKLQKSPGDILTVVPPMLNTLITIANESSYKMPEAVFFAGAPCNESVFNEFQKTYSTKLYQIYGTTESGGIASSFLSSNTINAVGMILKNMIVDIRNSSQYSGLGEGVGEVHIKSSAMMDTYTHGGIDIQEYWNSGDIGYFDEMNNLHLVGRIKDIINVGGNKVDPKDVEEVLLKYPGITDAVVYPGMVENQKEIVQAAIRTTDLQVNSRDLNKYCFKNLAEYKIPVKFHFLDSIPRTPSGKCLKIQLPDFPPNLIYK